MEFVNLVVFLIVITVQEMPALAENVMTAICYLTGTVLNLQLSVINLVCNVQALTLINAQSAQKMQNSTMDIVNLKSVWPMITHTMSHPVLLDLVDAMTIVSVMEREDVHLTNTVETVLI
jgi:uncharacterized protein (DUF2235 family)